MVWRSPRQSRFQERVVYDMSIPENFAELAAALRRGIALSEPVRGHMVRTVGGTTYACALGAAQLGSGLSSYPIEYWEVCQRKVDIPIELRHLYDPGVTQAKVQNIMLVANDKAKWSREQIARWLERLAKTEVHLAELEASEKARDAEGEPDDISEKSAEYVPEPSYVEREVGSRVPERQYE